MEPLVHECGVAMIRLRQPLNYYQEKYGTWAYGMNKLFLLMNKQYNRGQQGAGIACVKLEANPGEDYMFRERAEGTGAISEIFAAAEKKYVNSPAELRNNADFAYDPHLKRLYCIKEDFPYPNSGGVNWVTDANTVMYLELGNEGFDKVFNTGMMWNVCGKVTAAATGQFRAHNMGILTDAYGQLQNPYKIPVIYTSCDAATDYPNWNKGGQWPALHTYRLHGYVLEVK